jgi:hypothetical protein
MFIAFEQNYQGTPFGRAEFEIAFNYQQSLPHVRTEQAQMDWFKL